MAKVKNTGTQARGFNTEDGGQVVVQPGDEKEFNMNEADFNKAKEIAESEDPPLFEISGGAGGAKIQSAKEQRDAENKRRDAEAKEANKAKEK